MFASPEALSPSVDGNLEIYKKDFQTTRHLGHHVNWYSAGTGETGAILALS